MEWHLFQRAFIKSTQYGEFVTIGGGEPTLWDCFGLMIDWLEDMLPGWAGHLSEVMMITNGTRYRNTKKAIRLMERIEDLGEDPTFHVILSADDGFHDMSKVHPELWEYFHHRQAKDNRREFIRSVKSVCDVGRARNLPGEKQKGCGCSSPIIKPSGDILFCGCEDAPRIGHVLSDGIHEDSVYFNNNSDEMCWHYVKSDACLVEEVV